MVTPFSCTQVLVTFLYGIVPFSDRTDWVTPKRRRRFGDTFPTPDPPYGHRNNQRPTISLSVRKDTYYIVLLRSHVTIERLHVYE